VLYCFGLCTLAHMNFSRSWFFWLPVYILFKFGILKFTTDSVICACFLYASNMAFLFLCIHILSYACILCYLACYRMNFLWPLLVLAYNDYTFSLAYARLFFRCHSVGCCNFWNIIFLMCGEIFNDCRTVNHLLNTSLKTSHLLAKISTWTWWIVFLDSLCTTFDDL